MEERRCGADGFGIFRLSKILLRKIHSPCHGEDEMVEFTATVRSMNLLQPVRSIRNAAVRKRVLVELMAALALIAGFATAQSSQPAMQKYDIVVMNGRVMDPESGLDAVRN